MNRIKVNVIAGSGTYQGPGSGIFTDMIDILTMGIDTSRFELTITPEIDESKLYDVYHYFHSTLAVQNGGKMSHRALVTIHAMSDLAQNWSFEYKEPYLRKARKISSVSTSIINTLVSRGIEESKIFYTPAGVDYEKFVPTSLEKRKEIETKYNLKSDIIRFGIVSKRYDDGRKGESFLMDIINHFGDSDKYRFMIIGENWGSFIKNYDDYYGLFEIFNRGADCQYDDYPDLYGTMDALIVPSKVDAGPVCILEALATGLQVISTPTGLANELLVKKIDNALSGKIISHGDIYGFENAINNLVVNNIDEIRNQTYKESIRDLIINPDKYTPNSVYTVMQNHKSYSWNNFCKRFEDIYQEIYDECNGKVFVEDFMSDDIQKQYISLYSSSATNNLTNLYMENYEQIKSYAKPGVGITSYKNILKNRPAVIVGAGPSLDKNIEALKKYQGKISILACDAALPVLNKNQIRPDLVIVADPSDRQIQNFTGCNGKEFMTILPTVVHPMTFNEARKYDCIISWYNIADGNIELCKWIPKEVGYKGLVRPGVLTSSMVYQIAIHMGCGPVTFIGHDLSWSDINKGYASGISEKKIMYQFKNKMINRPVFLFPDINGTLTLTELSFINFIQWINAYLKEYNLEVFNSTGSGILYGENIIQIDFEEWCEKYQQKFDIPTFPLLYQIYREVKMGNDIPIIPDIHAG